MDTDGGRSTTPENYTEVAGVDKKASSDPLHVTDPLNERDDRKHAGNDDYVEITLDVRDNDSVTVHSVKKIGGGEVEQNSSARIRQVSEELKRLISFLNRQPVGNLDRTKFAAAHALEVLEFISKNDGGSPWAAVEKRFDELTNETDGLLSRSLFGDCIGMKGYSKEFGELFDSLSRRRNLTGDTINKAQFKEFWDQITTQSFHSRLRTFFDIQRYYNRKVDKDAEGWIGAEEVRKIIRLSASTNRSLNFERQANELAALIMEELDPGSCGYITIENLENLLLQEPTHVVRNTSARIGQLAGHVEKSKFVIAHALEVLEFINKNHSSSSWATMEKCFDELTNETNGLLPRSMFGECIGMTKDSREVAGELFDLLSRRRNITGDSINKAQFKEFWDLIADQSFDSRLQTFFDMVDKDADTWTTEEEVTKIISLCAPTNRLDIKKKAKDYAALIMEELDPDSCGYITIETLKMLLFREEKHVVREESHNFSDDVYDSDTEEGDSSSFGLSVVRNTSARIRLVSECNHLYSASKRYLEGRLDRTSSAAAHAFMGLQFISQDHEKTKDEVMQLKSKSLPVPFSRNPPKKLLRPFRSGIPIRILKVAFYPGNVLTLHMSKPPGFNYKSGQYMFVKCAAISSFEWHPFFITSTPSDDFMSVHIQTLGYWARQLKTILLKAYEPSNDQQIRVLGAGKYAEISRFPKILIDGPYSGQAQDYKKYKVVLLVGLGFGVTPMISIVKDIVNYMKAKEEEEDDGEDEEEYGFENDVTLQKNQPGNNFRMTRAYLYRVGREHDSFNWFIDVTNEVAEMDKNGVIEMHNYCISVYEEGDARSALITMLQSLNEAKNGVDVVSGTRVKTHFARPNWRNVYKQIARVHAGSTIGVFYCGKPTLAKELKELALEFSNKTSTKFHFYKEIF